MKNILKNLLKLSFLFIYLPFFSCQLKAQSKEKLSLEKIWYSTIFSAATPNSFNGLADGKTYCLAEKKDNYTEVWKYNIENGKKVSLLFSTQEILVNDKPVSLSDFTFSSDETKVVIHYNINPIYRNSATCDAIIYDLKTNKRYDLPQQIMYPTLSPDGKKVAYVNGFNLHVQELGEKTFQISNDGVKNEVRNGFVDWVYEEEFSMNVGFFWSPTSNHIAYYKFNETQVPEFTMDIYGSLYPTRETWKYPKAGEPNSIVEAYIFSLSNQASIKCETSSEKDQYIPRMHWDLKGDYLAIQVLNRHQNELKILKASTSDGSTKNIYTENNTYYIEVNDWIPIEGGDWLHLSEKSGYNQLWCLQPNSGKDKQISQGNFDIDVFYGFDTKQGVAYFNAGKDIATERQIFSCTVKNGKINQLSKGNGWHSATFIAGYGYFLDNFSAVSKPPVHGLYTANGNLIKILEENAKLKSTLEQYDLGTTTFSQFKNRYGLMLDYWILKPANFDENKKYPVLFHVYGGPGYQTAKNSYGSSNYLWHQYMAQQGYIIITVNNTGGGAQGEAFKKKTYLQLGNYETQDYIDAAKYFGALGYIDKTRMGIWGWSYGGYMSSNCITRGADYFKTAVAVAPVTSWRYYDNIYTERYMRTPQENALGYDTNSPINHVKEIKGNYLLIHGTGDDNVHFQNAIEMMMSLNNNNIPYESGVYPNKNHGIYGGKTRLHLYTKMTKFFLENL